MTWPDFCLSACQANRGGREPQRPGQYGLSSQGGGMVVASVGEGAAEVVRDGRFLDKHAQS